MATNFDAQEHRWLRRAKRKFDQRDLADKTLDQRKDLFVGDLRSMLEQTMPEKSMQKLIDKIDEMETDDFLQNVLKWTYRLQAFRGLTGPLPRRPCFRLTRKFRGGLRSLSSILSSANCLAAMNASGSLLTSCSVGQSQLLQLVWLKIVADQLRLPFPSRKVSRITSFPL